MATKRLIRIPEQEGAPPRAEETWREWLLRDYLRYWYWVLFLFLDVMTFLWLWSSEPLKAAAVIACIGLLLFEIFLYGRLWGRGGRFGPET